MIKRSPLNCKFWDFRGLGQNLPNSSRHYWNQESVLIKNQFFSKFESLFGVTRRNSFVLFHLNFIYFGHKEPIKVQIFRLPNARKKINQIPYVIFQATSQFLFKFCITFSVKTIIPLTFSSWNICFGQKKPMKVQFFRLLSALIKVQPIPDAIFETTRPGFIQIFFSVMKDNFSVFLQLKPCTLWTKTGQRKEIFRLLSAWVKIHQISLVIYETTSQFFLRTLYHPLVSWEITVLYFSAETLYDLDKKKTIKMQNFKLWLLTWNFTKFVIW